MDLDWNDRDFRNNYEKLLASFEKDNKGSQRNIWTNAKIKEVINSIKKTKIAKNTGMKLKSMEYYWNGKYEYHEENGQEYLTFKKKTPEQSTIRIIPREELFDFLKPIHISCGHGGRDKMIKSIKNKFYVPKKAIEIFNSLCPVCGPKKKESFDAKKSGKKQPIYCLADFNNLGVVDVIDFQSCPEGEFKWLLMYQDHATKFYNLRPLKTNEAREIAIELVKIFFTFGPPTALQSLTEGESIDNILKEIKMIWPECETINGSNCYERNQLKTMSNNAFLSMFGEKEITNWSVRCFFFQYHINTSTTAYKNVFCRGLKHNSSSTTEDIVDGDNLHRNRTPETENTHLITAHGDHNTILDSCNIIEPESSTSNDKNYPLLSIKVEHQEIKEEIKIEVDDSETSLEPTDDYNTEAISTNLDIQYTDFKRKRLGIPGMYDERYHFENKVEAQCAYINIESDDHEKYIDSSSSIQLFNMKTDPIEDSDQQKITCAVCQDLTFIQHTTLCVNCKTNIHKNCAKTVTDEVFNKNVFCSLCLAKQDPNLKNEEKIALQGIKRAAEETADSKNAKRVLPSAANSYVSGASCDEGYVKPNLDFIGPD